MEFGTFKGGLVGLGGQGVGAGGLAGVLPGAGVGVAGLKIALLWLGGNRVGITRPWG